MYRWLGFDDIKEAAFQTPSLTTIRQPLHQMGALAVQTLLQQLRPSNNREFPQIAVAPELIVRESTGPARRKAQLETAPILAQNWPFQKKVCSIVRTARLAACVEPEKRPSRSAKDISKIRRPFARDRIASGQDAFFARL